jgi:hypothetical protein
MILTGRRLQALGKISVLLQFCLLQIRKKLKWDRNQSSAITACRLIAWGMGWLEIGDNYRHN